jgi:HK97 family phage major capsid protein
MTVNTKELSLVIQEANQLSSKPNLSKREERRLSTLMMFAAAIKQGATLQELEAEEHNDYARANGLEPVQFRKQSFVPREQEEEIRCFQTLIQHGTKPGKEVRDMIGGNPISRIGTYTGLGQFVPTGFFNKVFASLKHADFIFNEEDVTFLKTNNGRLIEIPLLSDTENVATRVGGATPEGATLTEADIAATNHATLSAYAYKSPLFISSIESWQDVEEAATVLELFKNFASVRFALGASADLVNGTGVNGPTGILQQLMSLGAPTVVATGSSGNDGSGATGANSLGTDDFAAAFGKLDPSYLASDKVAWCMSMPTLLALGQVKDKYGRPVFVSNFNEGIKQILGIPVKICPSMPSIVSANTPVILGDFSYFATRVAIGDDSGISVFKERFAEFGKVGLRLFARVDCAVLWTGDQASKSPFIMIQNHS